MKTQEDRRRSLIHVMQVEVRRYPAESDLLALRVEVERDDLSAEEQQKVDDAVVGMPHRFALLHVKAIQELVPLLSPASLDHLRRILEQMSTPAPVPQE